MGSGIKGFLGVGSGITAPGSGITTRGIGISIVFCGIRGQNSQRCWDQGSKFRAKIRGQLCKRYDPVITQISLLVRPLTVFLNLKMPPKGQIVVIGFEQF